MFARAGRRADVASRPHNLAGFGARIASCGARAAIRRARSTTLFDVLRNGAREPLLKTIALVVSVAAFLALRAFVKFLLLPFRALRHLRKNGPIST